jgi:hypothetical protein
MKASEELSPKVDLDNIFYHDLSLKFESDLFLLNLELGEKCIGG